MVYRDSNSNVAHYSYKLDIFTATSFQSAKRFERVRKAAIWFIEIRTQAMPFVNTNSKFGEASPFQSAKRFERVRIGTLRDKQKDTRRCPAVCNEIRTLTLPTVHINLIFFTATSFQIAQRFERVRIVVFCDTKTGYPDWDIPFLYGGEKEIRTLVGVLAQTRFPVVRLRPTQPSLRADLGILSQNNPFVKSFFLFCLKTSKNIL